MQQTVGTMFLVLRKIFFEKLLDARSIYLSVCQFLMDLIKSHHTFFPN